MPRGKRRKPRKTFTVRPPSFGTTGTLKWRKSLLKEVVYEHYRKRVAAHFDKIVDAQIDSACGQIQLCYTDQSGRFKIIESPEELETLQAEGKTVIRVATRLANVTAQTDIMNRMMGKPSEPRQQVEITGQIDVVAHRLIAARKRLAANRPALPPVIDVPVKNALADKMKADRKARDAREEAERIEAQREVEETEPRVS